VPLNVSGVKKTSIMAVKKPNGFKNSSKQYNSPQAFTVPNTSCPQCGAPVFYYEHPNGARVYFDELGPPWPKHPCTVLAKPLKVVKKHPVIKNNLSQWESSFWKPLIIEKMVSLSSGNGVRVQATTEDFSVRLDLNAKLLRSKKCEDEFVDQLLMQARLADNNRAKVSITNGDVDWIMYADILTDEELKPEPESKKTIERPLFISKGKKKVPLSFKLRDRKLHFTVNLDAFSLEIERTNKKLIKDFSSINAKLEAWVQETSKGGVIVYIVDAKSLEYTEQRVSPKNVTELTLKNTIRLTDSNSPSVPDITLTIKNHFLIESISKYGDADAKLTGIYNDKPLTITADFRSVFNLTSLESLLFGTTKCHILKNNCGVFEVYIDGNLLKCNSRINVSGYIDNSANEQRSDIEKVENPQSNISNNRLRKEYEASLQKEACLAIAFAHKFGNISPLNDTISNMSIAFDQTHMREFILNFAPVNWNIKRNCFIYAKSKRVCTDKKRGDDDFINSALSLEMLNTPWTQC